MTDYKETLNLPKTAFPMKANLTEREPEILKRWQTLKLYQQCRERGKKRTQRFILHDGPPYANGRVHLGTALNKILKDIVVKSKLLSGYDAPYVPGWDCHGLPIELNVEKKVGKPGEKLSAPAFRQACRDYAQSQVVLQHADFERLGILGDWEHPYLTMDFTYEASVVRVLAEVIAHGHCYRGRKPVHWCTTCQSALAEAEVEYRDKSSAAIDVAFDVMDVSAMLQRWGITHAVERIVVPIWTTTPWTLPANQAVALHPERHYALVQCQWQNQSIAFILAKELVGSTLERYGIEDYTVHSHLPGRTLAGILLQHPFLDRSIPIVLGEHVTVEAGTGNVHTAPAHGLDDYIIAERYRLSLESPVDARGVFHENTALVGGQYVFKANESIMVALADSGHLLHSAVVQHSYPHCWRHKTPLIFLATVQWFISMDQNGLRQMALTAIKKIQWIPAWGEARIRQMVVERLDWCISRQRAWGIPIAVFVHKETGELHPDTPALMEEAAKRIEQHGVEAWFELAPETLLGKAATEYNKVTDTLDVWFDSGVTHYGVLAQRPELGVPADLYLEGSDQHRGWFQSSLLTSLAISGAPPYRSVLTHGYVVDGQGHKMSKSLGNVISPVEVMQSMGADILRLWVASSDFTGEIRASDEILKRSSDAYRRIRNTARFLLSNLNDFDPECDAVAGDQLVALDRWAIATAAALQQKILKAYEHYRLPIIYQEIHNFCTVEMGSFYLDIIKDRVYTSKKTGLPRRSAQTALYHIGEALVRWLAPILSFTSEEIWNYMPGKREISVFLTEWYQNFPVTQLSEAEREEWSWLMRVRDEVNKVLEASRNAGDIGSALQAEVILYARGSAYETLAKLGEELRYVLITSYAAVSPEAPPENKAQVTAIPDIAVEVRVTQQAKCLRCWQCCADVNQHPEHPGLCTRCVRNAFGEGETRRYA